MASHALRGTAALLALAVPGGLVVAGGVMFAVLYSGAKTGDPNLDRFAIRGRVVVHAILKFGPRVSLELVRACMAIVKMESAGKRENYRHDLYASGGPGIGPMAVNRGTAKDLGLWEPSPGTTPEEEREEFLALAEDEGIGIAWGVAVFADKLKRANGDVPEGLRRFNGSGPNAELYREKALTFARDTWGAESFS